VTLIHRDESTDGPTLIDGYVASGGFAYMEQTFDPALPEHVAAMGPLGLLVTGIHALCACDNPECPGVVDAGRIQLLIGYEGAAALAGQIMAWLDVQPVHVRDQGLRMFEDVAESTRRLMRQRGI
jgi:hypothetical protein